MSAAANPYESQARLWLVAFGVSALVNGVVLIVIGFWVLAKITFHPGRPASEVTGDTFAVIRPEMIAASAGPAGSSGATGAPAETSPPPPPPPPPEEYTRTSPDQEEGLPERADFVGERNTRAANGGAAVAGAPAQPTQKGEDPVDDLIDTASSRYRDGELAPQSQAREGDPTPSPPSPVESLGETAGESDPLKQEGGAEGQIPKPDTKRERLAEGPVPVERRVKAEPEDLAQAGESSVSRKVDGKDTGKDLSEGAPKPAASVPVEEFQRVENKTELIGSITRNGKSSLNVEDSMRGRYYAIVGAAVEKVWQQETVRNRDYITPGILTMSFLLDEKGKVRNIRVVDDLQVGSIPKGFTLKAINGAEIPAMPADLKKKLGGKPLEVVFRFKF